MSKMNYRRGGKGARRDKTPARLIPENFMIHMKRHNRRAMRRASKVEISIAMAIEGDYVPELKMRDCARVARIHVRELAAWEYV